MDVDLVTLQRRRIFETPIGNRPIDAPFRTTAWVNEAAIDSRPAEPAP